MTLVHVTIPVDYGKPEEFAAKLRVAAAAHPVMFMIEARFARMVANRLEAVDRAVAEMDAAVTGARAAAADIVARHDRWRSHADRVSNFALALFLAAMMADACTRAVLLLIGVAS